MTTQNCINNAFPLTANTPVYFSDSVTLSASQLNNLSTTPVQILPAPGANLANIITQIFTYSSTGTGYSGSGIGNIVNSSSAVVAASNVAATVNGTSLINFNPITNNNIAEGTYTNLNNQPLYLFGGNLSGGGTQTVTLWIRYFILPLV